MKTIVEPKKNIYKIWGKQRIDENVAYRLMRYVLQVDYDDKVFLHNVVTGQLIELEHMEQEVLTKLPLVYDATMKQLVADHYLVPEEFKEDEQIINLRKILQKLADVQRKPGIWKYTILTTTACNARCYYCYEKGITADTMTEQVADETVRFIAEQSKGQKVRIRWFGGEPTLAANRIDQISDGLLNAGVDFSSTMISNGYLFDEEMIEKASKRWNLDSIKISIDGTRKNYNRIKAYVYADANPYERIVRNIGLFLEAGIRVNVYMNFDKNNYHDFELVLNEYEERFRCNPLLTVRSHQLMLDQDKTRQQDNSSNEQWYRDMINELNSMSRNRGLLHREKVLPSLLYEWCEAASGSSATVLPNGNLVSCPEQLSEDQVIGDIRSGILNKKLVDSWRTVTYSPRCRNCVLFPDCMKIKNCASSDKCFIKSERMEQYRYRIKQLASELAHQQKEEQK